MSINFNINNLGQNVIHPDNKRNYTIYNEAKVDSIAKCGKQAIPYIENYLKEKRNDDEVFEALCVVDKMADYKTPELYKLYPVLSKYNDTNSPEIQVMLSGIYRKTLVPDAFGPLCRMLYKQISEPKTAYFDPTEETGGAILEYIRSYGNPQNNPAMFPIQNKEYYKPPMPVITSAYLPYNNTMVQTF